MKTSYAEPDLMRALRTYLIAAAKVKNNSLNSQHLISEREKNGAERNFQSFCSQVLTSQKAK